MALDSEELLLKIRSAASAKPLAQALSVLVEALEADHGAVLTEVGIKLQYPPGETGFHYSRLVVEHVTSTGEPLISSDVRVDRTASSSASLKAEGVRSVLCAPFALPDGEQALFYADGTRMRYNNDHLQVVLEVLQQYLEPLKKEVRMSRILRRLDGGSGPVQELP